MVFYEAGIVERTHKIRAEFALFSYRNTTAQRYDEGLVINNKEVTRSLTEHGLEAPARLREFHILSADEVQIFAAQGTQG